MKDDHGKVLNTISCLVSQKTELRRKSILTSTKQK